jgi:hypothetical protein
MGFLVGIQSGKTNRRLLSRQEAIEDVRRAVDQMPSIGKNLQGPIIIFYTHFSCFYEHYLFGSLVN